MPKNVSDETPNLNTFITANKTMKNKAFLPLFSKFIGGLKEQHEFTYCRKILSPQDREVVVWDANINQKRKMLMFASNNYLGLANSSYVKKKVRSAIDKYGVGLAGPPLLNGYSKLMAEVEERLAHLKHQESAMVFSSGYQANVGMLTGLVQGNDHVLFDELSHASFIDGLHMGQIPSSRFAHNNIPDLQSKLIKLLSTTQDTVFVGLEGVYSMDGDLAPLDQIIPILKKEGAFCLLDDAHGTGVLGKSGCGTAEHFGVEKQIDLTMGTFSKAFAMTGGFLAGSREVIDYLRFFARPYMFSAALTPVTLAAVLAGIDVIEKGAGLRGRLIDNARYAVQKLQSFGIVSNPEAAIIALKVPQWMDLRKANLFIHERGIFLNAIEYPAVPQGEERFRISITVEHKKRDINQLVLVLEEAWNSPNVKKS